MLRCDGNNDYDKLPQGVKLYVLSFLGYRDLIAALSVNQLNRNEVSKQSHAFVACHLLTDFGIVDATKFQADNLYQDLMQERKVLVNYLGAQDCLKQAGRKKRGMTQEEWQSAKSQLESARLKLRDDLGKLPIKEFLKEADSMIKQQVRDGGRCDRRPLFDKLYVDFVTSTKTSRSTILKMFEKMEYMAPELVDQEVVAIQWVATSFSRCKAPRSLEIFYNKLPDDLQRLFLNRYGKMLYREARASECASIVELLLSWGLPQAVLKDDQAQHEGNLIIERRANL